MVLGPARLADVGAIARLYREQSPAERALYHPFPFGRVRLTTLLSCLVGAQRARRPLLRIAPKASVIVWTVRERSSSLVIGFGTARFRRDAEGQLFVRTGLYVAPEHRRAGLGRALKVGLLAEARRMGARRAEALMLPDNEAILALNRALGFRVRPTSFRDRRAATTDFRLAELDLAGPVTPATAVRGLAQPSRPAAGAD